MIIHLPVSQPMPVEDPSDIGTHHKDRKPARIEKDRIGRFRSDALHIQKLLPEARGILLKHSPHRTLVLIKQKPNKLFQAGGLDVEKARWADHTGKLSDRYAKQGHRG